MCPGGSCTTTCDGAVYVFAGSSTGLGADPAWSHTGDIDSDLGDGVAGAGDVDADGYADLIVGASNAQAAYLFSGSVTGPSPTPAWSATSGIWGFGAWVARADDATSAPMCVWSVVSG